MAVLPRLRRTFLCRPSASPPEKYPRSNVSKLPGVGLSVNLSVDDSAIVLIPEDDEGRCSVPGGDTGDTAEPIVQFLSKEGCFLCAASGALAGDSAAARAPMREPPKSAAELCREWFMSRIDAAEGRFSPTLGRRFSWMVLGDTGDMFKLWSFPRE